MFNLFDIAVIGIILISGMIAFPRGLFKEIFSLANWGIAGIAGFYGATQFGSLATQYVTPEWLANVVAGAGCAIIAFIVASMITSWISNALLDSSLGIIDRILGLAYGIARGVVIVVPAYWLLRNFIPEDSSPPFLIAQATKPYMEMGRTWIEQNMPYFMDTLEQYRGQVTDIVQGEDA